MSDPKPTKPTKSTKTPKPTKPIETPRPCEPDIYADAQAYIFFHTSDLVFDCDRNDAMLLNLGEHCKVAAKMIGLTLADGSFVPIAARWVSGYDYISVRIASIIREAVEVYKKDLHTGYTATQINHLLKIADNIHA